MKRVIVSVTNDLVTDQRVYKICNTLLKMNYNLLLIGRKLPNSKEINRPYKVHRFNLLFNKGFLFYAEYNLRLFFKLFFLKKDILLSNDLDTLLPNFIISKVFRKKLVYDSHELFTEVPELIDKPFVRNFWLKIEKFIVPEIKNCTTVSNSIANYYNTKYNTDFKLIRNFPYKTTTQKTDNFPFETSNKKIILYQGAINKGRGLELMIETMQFINNTIFIIIGKGDLELKLKEKITNLNVSEKVKFISEITPKKLKKLTPLASLGISLEEDLGLNYRFALPNKLFDYINAKIPVLVSDLPEMKQIILTYNVGEIINSREPKQLVNQIEKLLKKETSYFEKKLEIAKNELIWENEENKLIEIFENLN
ncbi:glycosyltransferase involved in cell wall biosynthesis [Lutibacter oceani]|uniref:Glycosyltransferase involved in cell wall biosynthesis n=1 Tax=Lutibacter oceani TaxID=1853311 RepID=A0A3D9RKU2_9FLAO|nr:glycosyltransferase [Lutibacter oceani]REE80489.1 glycosyltransferase involved in cell wall biosynthesis [Lutibacter oceani]